MRRAWFVLVALFMLEGCIKWLRPDYPFSRSATQFIAQGPYVYQQRVIIGDNHELKEADWPQFFGEMKQYFDGLEVRVWETSDLSSYDPALLVRFIKAAHRAGLKVAVNFWEYPDSKNLPPEFRAYKLSLTGQIVPASSSDDYAFFPALDKTNAEAVAWSASRTKLLLERITAQEPVDYFMMTEDRLNPWDPTTPWPHQVNYWQGPTYSNTAAASFRDYTGHKLPVDRPALVNQLTEFAAPDSELWNQFYEWRFRIFAHYLGEMLKAASEAVKPTNGSFETIVMEWQRVIAEGEFSYRNDWPVLQNSRVFGVSAQWLSRLPELDHLVVEFGEDGLDQTKWPMWLNEKGIRQIAAVAEKNSKAVGGFIQAYSWPLHRPTPEAIEPEYVISSRAGARVIVVYDCAVFYHDDSRYSEAVVKEWQRVRSGQVNSPEPIRPKLDSTNPSATVRAAWREGSDIKVQRTILKTLKNGPFYAAYDRNGWGATVSAADVLDQMGGYLVLSNRPDLIGQRFTVIEKETDGRIVWAQYGDLELPGINDNGGSKSLLVQ